MRKYLLLLVMLLLVVVGVPALAQDATEEPLTAADLEPWVCPGGFEGQTLNVYNWSTYIAEDTVANFEELCGVTVVYDVFESNEALLSRLRQGNPGYDIIVPTDYMVQIMIEEGILDTIDMANVPNFVHVAENLISTPFDPNNEYSVPYQWGTVGIGYNRTVVGEDITSWQQMLDYEGNVAWLEDQRAIINLSLLTLGYEPNTDDAAQVAEARDNLIAHGTNVVSIAGDDGQALLERGDADIVVEYSGDIFQVIDSCECEDFAYVIPSEGANVWTDNLAIPVDAPNKPLAEVFIDYILDPQVSADIANYTAYGSPNQTAIDLGLIDEELLNNPGIYPVGDTSGLFFNTILTPEAEVAYLDAWDEIKIMLGQ